MLRSNGCLGRDVYSVSNQERFRWPRHTLRRRSFLFYRRPQLSLQVPDRITLPDSCRSTGEIEFWLSSLKILTLTGIILLGLIIDLGGVRGQPRIGFAYWQDGKAFKEYKLKGDLGRFLGFVNALVNALFAFMGTELVGVTVGEAKVRSHYHKEI